MTDRSRPSRPMNSAFAEPAIDACKPGYYAGVMFEGHYSPAYPEYREEAGHDGDN